jgi:glutathione synthase/RimK-type ligase-like ATP-grasp enzyme
MKIAIHQSKISYSNGWIKYCESEGINYKPVDCYSNKIIDDIEECDAVMWHYHHENPRDIIFARQLLSAIEVSGKSVFPDFRSSWHFDDKIGQKYLFEALSLPMIPTYVFYSKKEALNWIKNAELPVVMKLRNGSSGHNVRLIKTRRHAITLINRAFGRGFRPVSPSIDFRDQLKKFRDSRAKFYDVMKAMAHFLYPYKLESGRSREKGYILFQKFIPDCTYDVRMQFAFGNAWGFVRKVRKNDFRASGSGDLIYNKDLIPKEIIDTSFEIYRDLGMQTVAFDFLITPEKPLLVEICYAGGIDPEDYEEGYWDKNKIWHQGEFNPYGWMVEGVLADIRQKRLKQR